jgi:predicted dehydrogenase
MTRTHRRQFLKTAAGFGAALAANAYAGGNDEIRVGLVGCGGRGTGAAMNCLEADAGVKIVALGDAFKDRLEACQATLKRQYADRASPPAERCFVGLDAYKQVIGAGVDVVLLATPGAFRPHHLLAAVAAGKHVFAEKPLAVDATGVRRVLAAGAEVARKGVSVVVGTQRRYQAQYIETVRRLHDGAIGKITAAECWWNMGQIWSRARQPGWTDVEWQLRNWINVYWLSGDVIVELLLHNLDVVTWALKAHPVRATGEGFRLPTTGPEFGNRLDHFTVEYVFPGDVKVKGQCQWIKDRPTKVAEEFTGTAGKCQANTFTITGDRPWKFAGAASNPYVDEQAALIRSIRDNKPINDLPAAAESTLTAIMGRIAAYTGEAVTWDQVSNSPEDLLPPRLEWGPLALAPVPVQKK